MKALSLATLKKVVVEQGFNPSLPCALFDSEGNLVSANLRMVSMLGPTHPVPNRSDEIERIWPFMTEDLSGPALLRLLIGSQKMAFQRKSPRTLVAQSQLKTYRLFYGDVKIPEESDSFRLIVAEVMRSGDLLSDQASRQALFRSVSHEIRTSVLAMNGFLSILEQGIENAEKSPAAAIQNAETQKTLLARMMHTMKRLDSVASRLDEFKSELKLFEHEEKVPTNIKKKTKSESRKKL